MTGREPAFAVSSSRAVPTLTRLPGRPHARAPGSWARSASSRAYPPRAVWCRRHLKRIGRKGRSCSRCMPASRPSPYPDQSRTEPVHSATLRLPFDAPGLDQACMWLCYLSECSSANDGSAVMSTVMMSATIVRLRRANLRVARDRNRFGYRSGRIARERTEQAPGSVSLSGDDPICLFDTHITGARHTLESAESPLVFGEIGATW